MRIQKKKRKNNKQVQVETILPPNQHICNTEDWDDYYLTDYKDQKSWLVYVRKIHGKFFLESYNKLNYINYFLQAFQY